MPYGKALVDTVESSGNLAITGNVTVSGNDTANTYNLTTQVLGTATAGRMEYDGRVPYFTPLGTQRGVVPGMQYYRLENDFVGANQTTAQSWFNGTANLAVTLSSSTVYAFEALYYHYKGSSSTSNNIRSQFGGTATINNILYQVFIIGTSGTPPVFDTTPYGAMATSTGVTQITSAQTTAMYRAFRMSGTVSVNAGGTFIPQYSFSTAPGAGFTTGAGSYFLIYPIGVSGSNTSVGTWA